MRRAGEVNLKWSIADVDLVVGLARAGRTADNIALRLLGNRADGGRRIMATPEEIKDICWQSGIPIKAA